MTSGLQNAVRKGLYRSNPIAHLVQITKDGISYHTKFNDDKLEITVDFLIPFSDLGDGKFFNEMEAKYLGRWISEYLVDNFTPSRPETKKMTDDVVEWVKNNSK